MNAIVAAGGRVSVDEPLYPLTNGKPKALVRLGDRAMLEHVVAALDHSRLVQNILVAGLPEAEATELDLPSVVGFLPDTGGLIPNVRAGIEWFRERNPAEEVVLIVSADIPALTGDIVDAYLESCRPYDCLAYYNLVTRETMERRFPNSKRTFVKLKGLEIAGGDLTLVQSRIVETNDELWNAIFNARKHAWQLARIVGPLTILRLLFRRLDLSDIEVLATRLVGAPVRIVNSPYPEVAMDVDKPEHVAIFREILS